MFEFLSALKDTPVPTILVVAGLIFLFLGLGGKLSAGEIQPNRRKVIGVIGTILFFLGLGLFAINPNPSDSNRTTITPPNKVTTSSFEVYADQDWQDTGIIVQPGDLLEIKYVSGRWSECAASGCPFYDANGATTNDFNDNVMVDCKDVKLIGRVSPFDPFCIGNYYVTKINNSGNLELRINDAAIGDNKGGGSLMMKITISK